jgi:hypothetical protein
LVSDIEAARLIGRVLTLAARDVGVRFERSRYCADGNESTLRDNVDAMAAQTEKLAPETYFACWELRRLRRPRDGALTEKG